MNYYIAIDIGGTQIRVAIFPQDSTTPTIVKKIPTKAPGETPLDRLFGAIASVIEDHQPVAGMAIAVPGPVDPYQGVIIETPNIPGWQDLPLVKLTTAQFKVPVALGNDANMAALAEWRYGNGMGHKNLVYVTVSTGIGGGVILDNRLLLGQRGMATELGHITVDPAGPICSCGKRGHLEAMASGTALARWVEGELQNGAESSLKAGMPITAKDVYVAATQGDPLSVAAFQRAGTYLGRSFADFLHIFNPTILIMGGGVSGSGALLLEPLMASLRASVMSTHFLDNFCLTKAALGDEAGLMGALALAHSLTDA